MALGLEEFLPPALTNLILESFTLDELIEMGIRPSDRLYSQIVKNTLGEDVLELNSDELKDYFQDFVQNEEEIPTHVAEGFTMLLMLDRLPSSLISTNLISYLASTSLAMRRLVYPKLLQAILAFENTELDSEMDIENVEIQDALIMELFHSEKTRSADDSMLELLVELFPNKEWLFKTFDATELVGNHNTPFVLNHLDMLTITPEAISLAIRNQELASVGMLLHQLFSDQNRLNAEAMGITGPPSSLIIMMDQLERYLPEMHAYAEPRLRELEYMFPQEE